jgi:flagellar hook-associated protein 3 FlgL
MVQALNLTFGGRSLLAGRATDTAPLAAAETMMASIKAAALGVTTGSDLAVAVDGWFDTPGAGFDTLGYQGDTGGRIALQISETESVTQPVRADDPALKSLMKAFALAALSTDADIGLSMSEQAIAVERAGEKLFSATDGVVALQATLGRGEARVEDSIARHAARQTSFGILRNEMVAADPFETASALQEAETMLERHYLVTARLAGLSLAGYLR